MEPTTGCRIREMRQRKRLTQRQLGTAAGIAEPTIRRYESGKLHPKYETLEKIAAALGCTASELQGKTVEPLTESERSLLNDFRRLDENGQRETAFFCRSLLGKAESPCGTVGERIKAARLEKGLTQKELGSLLGLSVPAISQWETNLRNPKIETLQKIADALGCSVLYLRYSQKETARQTE